MKRNFILISACMLLVGVQTTRGQSILNATGNTRTIGTTDFDWSVGEVALVSTFYGPPDKNIIITQGLLQNELSTPEKAANTELTRNLLVYPNPASSEVNLQYTAMTEGKLTYRLMDMAGKMIVQHSDDVKPGATMEHIDISKVAAATYMLEVSFRDNNTAAATTSYKIEKLK
jgi:hypothetical protein